MSAVRSVQALKRRPWASGIVLSLGALLVAFPLIWMVSSSFKPLSESRSDPPALVPHHPTVNAYQRLFEDQRFGTYLINTLIVVAIDGVGLVLMAMAGYAFAKMRFRGRGVMFAMVLATMMVPVQITMIPTYLTLNFLGLTNTLLGIALPTLVGAFGIFLFRQFMGTIPDELLEAARIDGAGPWRTFGSIVLPMSRPILAVQAVLTFIAGWNSFLWPLIVADDQSKYTVAVGLSLLNKQQSVDPSLQLAGATFMVLPVLVVFVVFQRQIVRGFTMSGLK
ncbi:carbohydrate ABC transporter permease [Catenulispora subtropica]|uniref:Carbohydrate ABC transporter permease n=1 Tax=Catenulispora subtropica TaxID=450798 RepID=A0ABP5DZ35_9ACTN